MKKKQSEPGPQYFFQLCKTLRQFQVKFEKKQGRVLGLFLTCGKVCKLCNIFWQETRKNCKYSTSVRLLEGSCNCMIFLIMRHSVRARTTPKYQVCQMGDTPLGGPVIYTFYMDRAHAYCLCLYERRLM